jgi:hypothetical protein
MIRVKRTRLLIVALISALLLLPGVPHTTAGVCYAADRARVQRLFDYLIWATEKKLVAAQDHARDLLDKLEWLTLKKTLPLYMSMIRLEARWNMRRLLVAFSSPPDKMAEALRVKVDRAQRLLSVAGTSTEVSAEELKRIVDITAGAFWVCRAVRQKSPAPCAILEGNRAECESLAAMVMLQKGVCTKELIRILSGTWNKKAVTIEKYCEALASRRPEKCLTIPDSSKEEIVFCRALAGHGEIACRDPVLSKDISRDCLFELKIREVLAGKMPLSAVPDEYKKQELVWPALQAASSKIACDELALEAYDEMIAPLDLFTHTF